MPQISCVGRDGFTRIFEFRTAHDTLAATWTYRVTTIPAPQGGHFFELTVAELDSVTVRVVVVNHFNRGEYAAMGIPDALLPVIRAQLNRVVQSSPSRGTIGGVFRTAAATKYWERLRTTGVANYDLQADIYLIP